MISDQWGMMSSGETQASTKEAKTHSTQKCPFHHKNGHNSVVKVFGFTANPDVRTVQKDIIRAFRTRRADDADKNHTQPHRGTWKVRRTRRRRCDHTHTHTHTGKHTQTLTHRHTQTQISVSCWPLARDSSRMLATALPSPKDTAWLHSMSANTLAAITTKDGALSGCGVSGM